MIYNDGGEYTHNGIVVNCFQSSIFTDDLQQDRLSQNGNVVVNCFQSSIFTDDLQQRPLNSKCLTSCELLSKFYFY